MKKRFTAMVLVATMVLTPVSMGQLHAQQAVTDAQVQAEADTKSAKWLAAGCLLGVLGWAIASFMHNPEPPPSALLGKSPEYVAQYRHAYREKAQDVAGKKALVGCLINSGATVLLWVAVFAATESAYDY